MPPATPTTAPTELDRLLAGYARGTAPYDEMLAADGAVRPHWRAFLDGFAGLGPEGRKPAADSTRRSLRESGIAFDVHADPEDRRHAWRLDLVPVLLPDAEWDRIAAGVAQRARLIDAVLVDLYGEQNLLRDGSLPAAWVLGSPAFVRPSVERGGDRRRFLHAYACDLARTADVPTPFALRAYAVLGEDGDYRVLPGGLVRLAGAATAAALPNGFGSKDLWITSAAPERQPPSLLRAAMQEVHLRRTGRDLLSRTADNLFWLGRYGERAEGTMRLLRGALSRLLEDGRPDADPEVLRRLIRLFVSGGSRTAPAQRGWGAVEELAGLLMFGPQDYGLRDSLGRLQRNATLARDQISHDAWRMLNALHLDRRWRQPPSRALASWPTLELLDDGIRALNAFAGTEAENMTRNYAWRFLQIGRRIERAWHLARLTRALTLESASPDDAGGLRLLLELGDSFMTYRSRYLTTPLLAPVLDLLLLDETNPRGIAFQLRELDVHVALLPSKGPHRSPGQRLILKLLTSVRLAEVGDLREPGADGRMDRLAGFLDEIAAGLPELSDLIARSYFAHAPAPVVTLGMRRLGEP